MVGQKAIDELADSIRKEQSRGYDTQLFGIQYTGIHDGFLDHIKRCAAYIIHAITEGYGKERSPLHALETRAALLLRFVTERGGR